MSEARDRIPPRGPEAPTSSDPRRFDHRFGASDQLASPEQVRLDLELAGPMSRAFAYSIDYSLILIVMAVILVLSISGLQQLIDWLSEATLLRDLVETLTDWVIEKDVDEAEQVARVLLLGIGLWLILELFLTMVYFAFFETLYGGRTPGKRLTQLRVVTEDGAVLDARASLLRNLLRAVDTLPAGYVVGVVSMILSPRTQRLGDVVAGTIVVRERRADASELLHPMVVDPDVEAGFRFTRDELGQIGEVERRLIRRTLRRAESLSERAARPLVDRAVEALCSRIGREEAIPAHFQRDFLAALLQASERLL